MTFWQHNNIVVFMAIPPLVKISGAPYLVLPPGVHLCSLDECKAQFAFNSHRQRIFGGFERVVANLQAAGCKEIFLDGGFASNSPMPSDFDGCWNPVGVDLKLVDPVLFNYANNREAQKNKYFGEMFPSLFVEAASGVTFLEFLRTEKNTGKEKGILAIGSIGTVTP